MNGIEARFRKSVPGFTLDVALSAPGRGVTALFGPSGSGKTTVLRCVAGLERTRDGYLRVSGERWQDGAYFLPTHRRALGVVFQEASLFPHLSVRGNLDYGRRRVPEAERRVRFDEVVDLLGIESLLARAPAALSGGERQRVAIARALVTSPRLLLMDEPLASLDLGSRAEILPVLERLHAQLAIPVIYVSHSPDEVARLADHLVLLEQGRVRAGGAPGEMLARLDLPLAHGDDAGAVIAAVVSGHDAEFHLTRLEVPGGVIQVARREHPVGARLRVRIHARDVSLALSRPQDSSVLNVLAATVVEVADENPAQCMVRLDVAGSALLARVTRKSAVALALRPGRAVYAQVKTVALLG